MGVEQNHWPQRHGLRYVEFEGQFESFWKNQSLVGIQLYSKQAGKRYGKTLLPKKRVLVYVF